MSSESLHAPRDRLSKETFTLHHAIVSLMEELDAIDWYRQRADDTDDETLKALLLHNMREEMEHASMLLEWIRRNNADFARFMKIYMFTKAPILEIEHEATGEEASAKPKSEPGAKESAGCGFTIGSLRGD